MAKLNTELIFKVDASAVKSACEKVAIALKDVQNALEELQNSEIKIHEVKSKKS